MRSFAKAGLAGILGVMAVTATATTASADRWRGGPPRHYHNHYYQRDNSGAVIGGLAAGTLLGLGIGAMASQPRYYDDGYEVAPPRGVAWRNHVEYCLDRYRSYNPNTDTYIGRDGYEYRCRGSY